MAKTAKKAAKKTVVKKAAKPAPKPKAAKAKPVAQEVPARSQEGRAASGSRQGAFHALWHAWLRPHLYRGPHAVAVQASLLLYSRQPARRPAQAARLSGQEPLWPGSGPARRPDLLSCSPRPSSSTLPKCCTSSTARPTIEKNRIREWLFWQWDKLALPIFRLRARNRGIRQFGDEVRMMYDTEAKGGACRPGTRTRQVRVDRRPSARPSPTSASMAYCAMRTRPTST